jgi:IMP dehydrogenase
MSFMLQSNNPALTYDDISLVPAYSEIESRATIDLTTKITKNRSIAIPIIASPMDTVCGAEMAIAMAKLGGIGCIHRFMSIDEQAQAVIDVLTGTTFYHPIMAAIGANGDYLERAQALESSGAEIFLIDVAHGHHIHVKRAIEALKKALPSHIEIVAGNIATREGARDLEAWGADGIRAGIGGGSLCTTRVKTGFGVPNVSSLYDVIENTTLPVWACGGIRNSGDISKALALGASAVVLGSLLAGTKESPGPVIERGNGLFKRYRGAASLETKVTHGQSKRNVEGESTVVPFKGAVKYVVEGLLDGVRSALSYAGSGDLANYCPDIVRVTGAGITEAKPHLL